MIKTTKMLLQEYKDYSNIPNKIKRLVINKELFPIVKGIYETDNNTPGYCLSNIIYGPSYLSFEFALYYYGLIPENVYAYTSATCLKKKTKNYTTIFGNYSYQDIPVKAFPFGINIIKENRYTIYIATKEKALCDVLYSRHPVNNIKEIKCLLIDDLRIDENDLKNLNINDIKEMSSLYKCKNIYLLYKLLRRYK